MYFNKRSSQCYNQWARTVCPIQFQGINLLQMLKSTECDIPAVTVGDNNLSGLRVLKMFSRYIFRQSVGGFISFENRILA